MPPMVVHDENCMCVCVCVCVCERERERRIKVKATEEKEQRRVKNTWREKVCNDTAVKCKVHASSFILFRQFLN